MPVGRDLSGKAVDIDGGTAFPVCFTSPGSSFTSVRSTSDLHKVVLVFFATSPSSLNDGSDRSRLPRLLRLGTTDDEA